MALIETISSSDLFYMACRMDCGDSFGYAGWRAIGEYLEQLSDDIGENIDVDIIEICCEYSMAESVEEFYNGHKKSMGYSNYGIKTDDPSIDWEELEDEEKLEAIENYLQENTSVVTCQENLIIWQAF